jgi:cytochrome b6-f complex iron-sulfur subunit
MDGQGCSRRTMLGFAGGLGVGLVGLAGCSSKGGGASTAAAGAPAASAGGAAVELIKLADVPVGGSVAAGAKVNGKPVVVSQKAAGSVTAFSAICTHMGCTVDAAGAQFHCPCHGSVYDAFTGQVVHGPAPAPLTAIPVKVAGGEVVTS